MHDYHVHSNYSDGSLLYRMVDAAAAAGLDGVGFADHCLVSERESMRRHRATFGFNLDVTHERRREGIEHLRGEFDLVIHDAVEMDYHPEEEDGIRAFLADAGFDYAIGSVHELDGVNVHFEEPFAARPDAERAALVDRYFEHLVALVESELFDVAAHPDLVERNRALRGLADESHYRAVAAAFADSRTVPELNAGRVTDDYGEFHPSPTFLDVLAEYDVPLTVGTDSHTPGDVAPAVDALRDRLAERGIDPVAPPGLG